jgi:hypothetical protein
MVLLAGEFCLTQPITIHGVVRDAEDNSPLPSANVRILGTTFGTASNFAGEFSLTTSHFPAFIVVSYVGYRPDTLQITESKSSSVLEISLHREPILLPEVEVIAQDSDAVALIKRVYEQLTRTPSEVSCRKAFYRQYGQADTTYTEIIEIFFDLLLNSTGIIQRAVEQGRYAMARRTEQDTTPLFSVTNLSDLTTKHFTFYQEKESFLSFLPFVTKPLAYRPIREDGPDLYFFRREGMYHSEGRTIAVISFVPKPGLDRPAFSGTMHVDLENLRLVFIEQSLEDQRVNLFPYEFRGYYQTDYVLIYKAGFKRETAETNQLSFVETKLTFKERHRIHANYERPWTFRSLLVVFDSCDPQSFTTKGKPNERSDIANVRNVTFDSAFWKKHSDVLNEIPIEDAVRNSFIRRGFYGNLFPGGIPVPTR